MIRSEISNIVKSLVNAIFTNLPEDGDVEKDVKTDDVIARIEPDVKTDDVIAGIEPDVQTDDVISGMEPDVKTDDVIDEQELETGEELEGKVSSWKK